MGVYNISKPPPPPNSAEPLGSCRRVQWNLLHSRKPAEEKPSHRIPKVLQIIGSQAQLFRPLLLLLPLPLDRKLLDN